MIILAFFLIIQVYNRPYFTKRLNQFHNLAIFLCLWYCLCRVVMIALVQYNNGGQSDPDQLSNIKIPEEYYVATRSYIDMESSGVNISMYGVFLIYFGMFSAAVLYFIKIMRQHFFFYLVD